MSFPDNRRPDEPFEGVFIVRAGSVGFVPEAREQMARSIERILRTRLHDPSITVDVWAMADTVKGNGNGGSNAECRDGS